ncbi:hypothetical protein Tco_1191924 [Tanacetum coccineum]
MSDVERVDMGSQAEASSSSKRDMGSYISTMKPSDVKALTRKYKIPRDLHPVAVSSEWTMDRLTDEYIGLYEQYFEFAGLRLFTMSEYLRLPFLSGNYCRGWGGLEPKTKRHPTTYYQLPLNPKIVVTRIRKANAVAKRKADKNRKLEGAVAIASDVSRGDNRLPLSRLKGIFALNSISAASELYTFTHRSQRSVGRGKVVGIVVGGALLVLSAYDGSRMLVADGAGLLIPPLFCSVLGNSPKKLSDHSEECPAWFSLARGAMAQAHTLCQFESLYDTHHALQESLETTRSQLCSEGLASVQTERDSLMATNAEQAIRIKELEQQLKSVDEVHSSAVKDLESQLAQKDSALVYAERVSGERLSENEGLRAQLAFAQKEKTDAIRELLPTVVGRLLQSHELQKRPPLSVPIQHRASKNWMGEQGPGLKRGRKEYLHR